MKETTKASEDRNALLREWSQGDYFFELDHFVFHFDHKSPSSKTAIDAAKEGITGPLLEEQVAGFVVITQTCDIVRAIEKRPLVEVAALVKFSPSEMKAVQQRTMPRYIAIPSLVEKCIVVDLDRIMTIEKPILLACKRHQGLTTDKARRDFSADLWRKWARPAMPELIVKTLDPLRLRFEELFRGKGKEEELQIQNCISEVRLFSGAAPWDQSKVMHIWFMLNQQGESTDLGLIAKYVHAWIELLTPPTGLKVEYKVLRYDDMSAAHYVDSEKWDLERLS